MSLESDKQESLVDEAWRILHDLVHDGRCTLTHGRIINPTDGELVRTYQWLASQKPPKKRRVPISEDFIPKSTEGA